MAGISINKVYLFYTRTLTILLVCAVYVTSYAQRKGTDFIAPCGPVNVGKFIPVIKNEIDYVAYNYPKTNKDRIRIDLEADMICNEGQPVDLVDYLNEHPLVKIEISAHAHSKSTDVSKTKLWADHVKEYLVAAGIEESRIETYGRGKTQLLISDQQLMMAKSPAEQEKIRSINQRIEIKIIADQYKPYFGIADAKFYPGQKLDPALGDQLSRQYDVLFSEQNKTHEAQYNPSPTDTAYRVLNVLAIFLQTHPGIKIEIGVYTDSRGDAASNQRLSHARANALIGILIKKGVKNTQLLARGYGEKNPFISDQQISQLHTDTEKENAYRLNRRIVIRIQEVR